MTTIQIIVVVVGLAVCAGAFWFWQHHKKSHLIQGDKAASGDKKPGNHGNHTELSQKLQTEQLKSAYLINAITDGVIVFDGTGKIQLINPAAANMLGWPVEEATDLDSRSVFTIVPKQAEKPNSAEEQPEEKHPFQEVLDTAKPFNAPALTIKTRSGANQIIVSLGVSPIMAADNQMNGAIAVFRDVSREVARERERSEFVSTASHEMRTPVAAIEGFLALAMNPKISQIDDRARNYVKQAHDATQHLGKLFQDLLTSTKAEDGRLVSSPQIVEIGDFLEKLINRLRFMPEKKGLKIEYIINASKGGVQPLYYVMVDPDRLEEVITNLFDNAVKYTDKGTVSVGLTGDSDTVQIYVRDQGIGIPPEDVPHLFQKFYRVDSSKTRATGGTGLGLFISKKIIDLYGGKIWAESKLGEGSTFYINLERLDATYVEEVKSGRTIIPTKTGSQSS